MECNGIQESLAISRGFPLSWECIKFLDCHYKKNRWCANLSRTKVKRILPHERIRAVTKSLYKNPKHSCRNGVKSRNPLQQENNLIFLFFCSRKSGQALTQKNQKLKARQLFFVCRFFTK